MNAVTQFGRSGDIYRQEIAALRGKIELIKEENRQLRELLVPTVLFPLEWRLTPQEGRLLASLFKAPEGYRTRAACHAAACGFSAESDGKIIDVLVCRIRAKLSRFGVGIETVWGQGFRLTAESRTFIASVLAGQQVAA